MASGHPALRLGEALPGDHLSIIKLTSLTNTNERQRCVRPTRSPLYTSTPTRWFSIPLRFKNSASSEVRSVGGMVLFNIFHYLKVTPPTINIFSRSAVTLHILTCWPLTSISSYHRYSRNSKLHSCVKIKLKNCTVQMEFRGTRATLSSNYSSISVTCRKVGEIKLPPIYVRYDDYCKSKNN